MELIILSVIILSACLTKVKGTQQSRMPATVRSGPQPVATPANQVPAYSPIRVPANMP